MKLISCENCAVILDADKLNFPYSGHDGDGYIDKNCADYDQETKEFRVYVSCPVCGSKIFGERV